MHPVLKRGLHWAGLGLAITGLVFMALRLRDEGVRIDWGRFGILEWSMLAALALVYGLSNWMLALAWWNLLAQFGATTSRRWAVSVYGISQIAKYVPGNIFHLAGRQAMGMAADVGAWSLAKSLVWELGLIAVTGGLFGVLVLPFILPDLSAVVSALGFAVIITLTAALLKRMIGAPIARAFGWYVGFLTVSGLLFVNLIRLIDGSFINGGGSWLIVIGAYVLAWLIGLLTPGAPAGIGVRELVLLFLLKNILCEEDLLLAVMLGRMVTVVGDLGFFVAARMLNAKA